MSKLPTPRVPRTPQPYERCAVYAKERGNCNVNSLSQAAVRSAWQVGGITLHMDAM